ncbi:MAG: hypothetical protein L6V88_00325 [Anaerotruncus sp.]|nr:MAG: hypothetical protein L6V88_00325 [Anaerotruncus sp.]
MNFDNLCMNCFGKSLRKAAFAQTADLITIQFRICCFFAAQKPLLAGRYLVGNFLSQESDAVTYIGLDTETNTVVTIREFMPAGIANRLEGNLNAHVREKYKKTFDGCKKILH